MLTKKIATNIYSVSLGFVNVYLIDKEQLTLIDTGVPGSEKKIIRAIQQLGYQPKDLRNILISHLHYDHTGSLQALKRETGAIVYMHSLEADAYSNGNVMRTVEPSPGILNALIVRATISGKKPPVKNESFQIDQTLQGGEEIPGTGGVKAIHTPGHTAGHLAFFILGEGGTIFLGDAASNMVKLGFSILYENFQLGKQTLTNISRLSFERACFSHGGPILSNASAQLQARFHN